MSIEVDATPASTVSPLKRPHPPDDEETTRPSTPAADRPSSAVSSILSTPAEVDSPMPSTNPTSTSNSPSKAPVKDTSSNGSSIQPSSAAPQAQLSSAPPPTKRRKLTPAEKLQQEEEKNRKALERAQEKARKEAAKEAENKAKEEEKRRKDEEKKQKLQEKDEEKRKKAEERELKQKLKDFEKQQKDDEKEKRERSQLRLSSFFSIPKTSSPGPLSEGKTLKAGASPLKNRLTKEEARRRSMSLDPVDSEPSTPTKSKSSSNNDKQAKQAEKSFLPFELSKNMRLAKHNAFLPDAKALDELNKTMDSYAEQSVEARPSVIDTFKSFKCCRGFETPKAADVVCQLQGSSDKPIDLTQQSLDSPIDALKTMPLKFFFYGEDVRPPYRGTWTRPVGHRLARKLALRPLLRELPEVNYDYDSEAEWDDADEGEDIEIEDNEEEEEEEEEMEGFIDDDNAPQYLARRGLPANDVEPHCSGIQWEDHGGKLKSADSKHADADFSEYAVCFLLDPSPKTIDPFTTAYWDPEPKVSITTLPLTSTMGPPRHPLQDRTNKQSTMPTALVNGKVPKAAKVGPRLVPADVMPAFKAAIGGSDMTKIALIESLKKQFPKLRKDEITETLSLVAKRVGAKQTEKHWVLLEEAKA